MYFLTLSISWRTSKEPGMIAVRTASRPCLSFKRFQGALRVRRAGRNARSSKPSDQECPASKPAFEFTCQVTPPPIGLVKLSPSCLQRERFSAAVGQNESGKGRPPLEAAVPQNEIYHRRCWRALRSKMWFEGEARLLTGTSRVNLEIG